MDYRLIVFISLFIELALAHYFFSKGRQLKENNANYYIFAFLIVFLFYPMIEIFGVDNTVYVKLVISFLLTQMIALGNDLTFSDAFFWIAAIINIYKLADFVSLTINMNLLHWEKYDIYHLPFVLSTYFIQYLLRIIILYFMRKDIYEKDKLKFKTHFRVRAVLFSFFTVSILAIVTHDQVDPTTLEPVAIRDMILVFLLSFLTIMLFYAYTDLLQHFGAYFSSEFQKQAMSYELRRIEDSKKHDKDLAMFRHDLVNHSIVIQGMIESQQYDKALTYLRYTTEKANKSEKIYSHNLVLNYVLKEKLVKMEETKATITTQIRVPEDGDLEMEIFSVVVGNLLDNATAALQRLGEHDKKLFDLKIVERNRNLIIKTLNTFDKVEIIERKNRTEIDGIGRKSIKSFIEENNGIYKETIDNEFYKVEIVLMDVY
ncbi:MAG: GHKL domain-containing protein [Streptococcaceae bacterium]|jgi:hypothetical protein|nr:GHKL domain-containing protein [Streptococcaceae bacterium]